MRSLRALGAVFALLALVAGIPTLLAATIGNPLAGWPDLAAGDLSDAVLADVLAAVAYLAWAQFAVAVIAETLGLLTGVRMPSRFLIVPAGQRRLARALLATAFLISPQTSAAFTGAVPSPAPVVATAPLNVAVSTPTTFTTDGAAAAAHHSRTADATDDLPTYTIRADGPGTYWDLAEHFLGDGQRWPQIWHLNDGRRQPDGAVMTSPGLLRPGWTVLLPASATHLATDAAHAAVAHAEAPSGEVTVRTGDSLWAIAETHLGDGRAWPQLYRLNRGEPQPDGGRLTDPDLIHPGWILRLRHEHADADAPAATGPEQTRPAQTEPAQTEPAQTEPEQTEPAQTEPAQTEPEPGRPGSAEPTAHPAVAPAHRSESATGVDLPGGWVTIPFAAAVSAAGALVWLRRRHRHRYLPLDDLDPTGDGLDLAELDLDDPDLQPLPAIVDRLRRAVREHAPRLLDPPSPQPTVTEYVTDPDRYRPPPVGPAGPDLVGLADLDAREGLGLSGPGADAAARALLVAVLSAGGPQDPDASGRLVIPVPTLESLLEGHAPEADGIPRLHVTAGVTQALDLLEQEHLQRLRTLDEYDVQDITRLRDADPACPPMPPVVLLTHAPPEGLRARLLALGRLGAAVGLRAVVLGEWPPGATIDVGADGTTTIGAQAHRVATLDVPSTADLLRVLREAHPDADEAHPGELDVAVTRPEPTEPPALEEAGPAPAPTTDADLLTPTPSSSRKVAIRLFGRIAVLDARGEPVPGLRQHAGGLLAYLVIHRAGADKNDIMEALWPEASLRRAAERLSTEVGNLRRCIRQAAADQDAQPVINTGGRYHLDASLVDVDAWAFQDALRRATTATDPGQRHDALREAVAAHAGPLADGRDYPWLEPAREQLRRHGVRARLHLADLVSADDPRQAADLTKTAAGLDPTNEELARLAMGAHARVGDTLAVAARLRHLRAALREIDEEPSPETLTLAAQLQHRDDGPTSTAAPARTARQDPRPTLPTT